MGFKNNISEKVTGKIFGSTCLVSTSLLLHIDWAGYLCFQESQIKRIFGTMINQKLQDFEEDVKALGDLMTQVT